MHSSNIGTARMAMMVGVTGHQAFLRKMGQLTRLTTELPESAMPLVPKHWSELNTITIAFGQGLNVAPLQAADGGGRARQRRPAHQADLPQAHRGGGEGGCAARGAPGRVSESLRYLMRLNAEVGSARKRQHPGLFHRRQDRHGRQARARPLLEGQGVHDLHGGAAGGQAEIPVPDADGRAAAIPGTYGYHTAAWNSGEVTGKIIERVTPLLGIPPQLQLPVMPFPLLARMGYGQANVPQHSKEGLH